jgi:uncharacterized oxidoreductase
MKESTMNITGNTVFIPGATSGIGLGLALRLQAAGNRVIVGGRRTGLLASITAEHPGIESIVVDTADAASVARALEELVERFPETNVLITMAGIMRIENLRSGDFLATAEATIATNLLGPIRLIAGLVEHLSSKADAAIVTVSSGLAFVPLPVTPTYNATKAAIHSFTEVLRLQLADTGVQVVELAPPAVQTTLLPGQEDSPNAMPLEEFLSEVMELLETQPNAKEILVERVKPLRFAEATGTYDEVLAMLGAH